MFISSVSCLRVGWSASWCAAIDHAGGLALDQVLSVGLAGHRLGAEHPEEVVAQLEGFADRFAVSAQA